MKFKKILQKLKQKFRENAPNWLFAIVQMVYWALHPKYPFIKIFPARGYWVAQYKRERLYVPSPRTAILGHFLKSYERVYERYFRVKKDEIVLDIGAYIGSFTMTVAKRAKKVLAIEPDPKNYACLRANVSRFANVRTIRKGVWNSKKKLKLYLDSRYPVAHSVVIQPGNKSVDIEVDALDNIVSELGFNKVDFIKMNIEGAEIEALEGAKQVLKSVKKIVLDAHHIRDGKPTYPLVCQFLEARGFKTYVANETETVYAWREQKFNYLNK